MAMHVMGTSLEPIFFFDLVDLPGTAIDPHCNIFEDFFRPKIYNKNKFLKLVSIFIFEN